MKVPTTLQSQVPGYLIVWVKITTKVPELHHLSYVRKNIHSDFSFHMENEQKVSGLKNPLLLEPFASTRPVWVLLRSLNILVGTWMTYTNNCVGCPRVTAHDYWSVKVRMLDETSLSTNSEKWPHWTVTFCFQAQNLKYWICTQSM